ncbi:MAG TPA: CPBP family glutamic-type intramembrane protease [Bdellovibrionales bacterium]|nr:CPBP family glutamic-type intramembrane protease [Bdellovibrionales bacterium]
MRSKTQVAAVTVAFLINTMGGMTVFAQPPSGATEDSPSRSIYDFEIRRAGKKRSSLYWHPVSTFFVPGLAQFTNGQTEAGFVYAGVGAVGVGTAIGALVSNSDSVNASADLGNLNDRQKAFVWGAQTYQTAGSLSTYHAFRSVVKQRQELGEFGFLKVDEHNGELMTAPFKVEFLARPSTFIPLALLAGGLIYYHNNEGSLTRPLTLSDGLFSAGASYNAGVGEEALFRGYLMMNLRESWGSDFWSNTATAAIFAAAHLSEHNKYPWPQFIMGYYLGWMTQANQWTLAESIFLHTWWDVLALSAAMAESTTSGAVWLPLAMIRF